MDSESSGVEDQPPPEERSRLHKITVLAVWLLALVLVGLVLALSWVSDSRMSLVRWLPGWLAGWADSGGGMETLRTAVPMVVAGFLFTLAWRVSGWKHWILGGMGLAFGLLVVAELGQFFLPARTPSWGDLGWGGVGVVLGVLVAGVGGGSGGGRRWRERRLTPKDADAKEGEGEGSTKAAAD